MTCDAEWKKFIQVNIYGRTLQELSRQGIVLETVLNDIGCSKVWIVEGSMYNSETPPTSEDVDPEDDDSEDGPVLSTTIANVKLPRFSTPIAPQIDLDRKFTLNLPRKFSTIDPDFEVEFIDTDDSVEHQEEPSEDVEGILDDILEKVVEDVEKKPILSTTIAQIPRCSTPISSHMNLLQITLDIPEILSEIDTDGEEEVIRSPSEDVAPEDVAPEDVTHLEDSFKSVVSSDTSVKRRRSLRLNMKNTVKIEQEEEMEEEEEPMNKRPALVYSITETKPLSNLQNLPIKSVSAQPDFNWDQPPQLSFHGAPSFDNQGGGYGDNYLSFASNVMYEEVVMDEDPPVYADLHVLKREESEEEYRHISMNMDYEDVENEYDVSDFTAPEDDETAIMEIQSDSDIMHTPPPLTLMSTKSILKAKGDDDDGEEKVKKTVSFRVPKKKRAEREKKLDEVHHIKCYFENCNKTYLWRKKYGRMRLVDHALTHMPNLEMKCDLCDHVCKGIRTVRYHHKKAHPNSELEGFGIRKVVNDSKKETDFADVWDLCFKQNPAIRNVCDFTQLRAKDQNPPSTSAASDAQNAPSTSSNPPAQDDGKPQFTFFRIR